MDSPTQTNTEPNSPNNPTPVHATHNQPPVVIETVLESLQNQMIRLQQELNDSRGRNSQLEAGLMNLFQTRQVSPPYFGAYRGEKKEKEPEVVDAYLNKWSQYFSVSMTPEKDHITFATMYLEGKALSWWKELKNKPSAPSNWDEFCKAFREAFIPTFEFFEHYRKFHGVCMTDKGLDAYIQEFNELMEPLLHKFIDPELKLAHFLVGLPGDYQVDIRKNKPKTLEEAIRFAKLYDESPT